MSPTMCSAHPGLMTPDRLEHPPDSLGQGALEVGRVRCDAVAPPRPAPKASSRRTGDSVG